MTFAGFWIDGAVRKPEARHCDMDDTVITKWKREHDAPTEFDICRLSFSGWDKVYWLDTTPRESLTPEELFSVLKVIWPKCEAVFAPDFASVVQWQITNEATDFQTPITWNDVTQYPPPTEPQWVRITRENVGQYLFRLCRFQDSDGKFHDGHVVGWDITDECCLVDSDYLPGEPVLQWDVVEVQNAPAP